MTIVVWLELVNILSDPPSGPLGYIVVKSMERQYFPRMPGYRKENVSDKRNESTNDNSCNRCHL